MDRPEKDKKYVVVLAHADGWGAESANKVLKSIHEKYPDIGIHLVVSQATKKDGRILTKLEDLRAVRALKETNLLEYFRLIDERYEKLDEAKKIAAQVYATGKLPPGVRQEEGLDYMMRLGELAGSTWRAECLTFKQLAKRYCADGEVHYSDRGGPKGGEQVAEFIKGFEQQHGKGPEVLLSVDTMAILPKEVLERYQCFSTHPGPLDTIKIEGMQGTLRSLANQVLYDHKGAPLSRDEKGFGGLGLGPAYVKGTLFMQHPELDKGPPIAIALTPAIMGMCAYQTRNDLYHALTDEMLTLLPTLLDKDARTKLVAEATRAKEALDAQPHRRIDELSHEQLATWQNRVLGIMDDSMPHGIEMLQNQIVNADYFQSQMRRFFPGNEEAFRATYDPVFGAALEDQARQNRDRLPKGDSWAQFLGGVPDAPVPPDFEVKR